MNVTLEKINICTTKKDSGGGLEARKKSRIAVLLAEIHDVTFSVRVSTADE